jgi:hypothetical protein
MEAALLLLQPDSEPLAGQWRTVVQRLTSAPRLRAGDAIWQQTERFQAQSL